MAALTDTGKKLAASLPIKDQDTYKQFRMALSGIESRISSHSFREKYSRSQPPLESFEADREMVLTALRQYEAEHGMEGAAERGVLYREDFCAEWEIEDGEPHPPLHPGYTAGALWNGWSTPYFTYEEAFKVMEGTRRATESLCKAQGHEPPPAEKQSYFDAANDAFVFRNIDDPDEEEPESFSGKDYDTEDGRLHLYPIGAYCWTWTVHEEEEEDEPV